jgi:hypothetical protein
MRIFIITISILSLAAFLIYPDPLFADTQFECGFIQEKLPNGKSNEASCSMDPDKVYSTARYQHKQNEHCDIDEVINYTDYIDFYVSEKTVSWKSNEGVTQRAKSTLKAIFMKRGESPQEAEKIVNAVHVRDYAFPVFSHYIGQQNIYLNSLTQQPYEKPYKERIHIFTFGDYFHSFSLYVPEISKKAILIEYSSMEDASWVNIRFGTCREISPK